MNDGGIVIVFTLWVITKVITLWVIGVVGSDMYA